MIKALLAKTGIAFLIALFVASGITTFFGMKEFANFFVSLFATIGVHGLMFFFVRRISRLKNLFTSKFWLLIIGYLGAVTVSVFFSFFAFFGYLSNEDIRRSVANLEMRGEWNDLYSDIERTERDQLYSDLQDYIGSSGYLDWKKSFEALRVRAKSDIDAVKGSITRAENELKASGSVRDSDKDRITNLIKRLEQDGEALKTRLSGYDQQLASAKGILDGLKTQVTAKKIQADTELLSGGTVMENGSVSSGGEGPFYNGYMEEYRALQQKLVQQEAVTQELQTQVAATKAGLDNLEQSMGQQSKQMETLLLSSDEGNKRAEQVLASASVLRNIEEVLSSVQSVNLPEVVPDEDTIIGLDRNQELALNFCLTIGEDIKQLALELEEIGLNRTNNVNILSSLGTSCSQLPTVDKTGRSFSTRMGQLREFSQTCSLEQFPNPTSLEELREARSGSQQDLDRIDELSASNDSKALSEMIYEVDYERAQKFMLGCAAENDMQQPKDLEKAQDAVSTILRLYNPKAHPFTQVFVAFSRGDQTVMIALLIALVVGGLILLFGLSFRKFVKTLRSNRLSELELAISDFWRDRALFMEQVYKNATPVQVEVIKDGVRAIYADFHVDPESVGLMAHRTDLEELVELGVCTFDAEKKKYVFQQSVFLILGSVKNSVSHKSLGL